MCQQSLSRHPKFLRNYLNNFLHYYRYRRSRSRSPHYYDRRSPRRSRYNRSPPARYRDSTPPAKIERIAPPRPRGPRTPPSPSRRSKTRTPPPGEIPENDTENNEDDRQTPLNDEKEPPVQQKSQSRSPSPAPPPKEAAAREDRTPSLSPEPDHKVIRHSSRDYEQSRYYDHPRRRSRSR